MTNSARCPAVVGCPPMSTHLAKTPASINVLTQANVAVLTYMCSQAMSHGDWIFLNAWARASRASILSASSEKVADETPSRLWTSWLTEAMLINSFLNKVPARQIKFEECEGQWSKDRWSGPGRSQQPKVLGALIVFMTLIAAGPGRSLKVEIYWKSESKFSSMHCDYHID